MLGIDASVITGYEGSQAYILAVVRGDGDVALGASNSIGAYATTGDLRVIASLERSSSYPNAQTPAELGIPDLSQLALQRMLGAPPNLDPEARTVLIRALQEALADEELIGWSESIGLPFAPLSADEAAASITNQRALYEQFKDFL